MTHRGPFQPLPFCDSVIIFLGTLVAFKYNKTFSYTEFRSIFTCIEINSTVNFCDSVLARYQPKINTHSYSMQVTYILFNLCNKRRLNW